jgi:hypothetical protein
MCPQELRKRNRSSPPSSTLPNTPRGKHLHHLGHCKHPCMPSLSWQPATRHCHLRATPPRAMGSVYPGHRMSSGNHSNNYEFGRDQKHVGNRRLHSPRHPPPLKTTQSHRKCGDHRAAHQRGNAIHYSGLGVEHTANSLQS